MLQGSFKILKKDQTGKTTFESEWTPNVVTDGMILQFGVSAIGSSVPNSNMPYNMLGEARLAVASDIIGHAKENNKITRNIRYSSTVPEIPAITDVRGTGIPGDPYHIEWAGQYLPPGTDQTVRVIAITRDNRTIMAQCAAFTVIEPPVVQTTLETLIVFYRLEVNTKPNQGLSKITDVNMTLVHLKNHENLTTQLDGYFPLYAKDYWLSLNEPHALNLNAYDLSNRSNWWINNPSSIRGVSVNGLNDPLYNITKTSHYGRQTDGNVGKIVGSIVHNTSSGSGGNSTIWKKLLNSTQNKTQNLYSHRIAPGINDVPFFNALNISSSNGLMDINSSAWTDSDWPNQYKIDISTTGNIGTAEYAFMKRRITGFVDNFYTSREEVAYMHHDWSGTHPIAVAGGFQDSAWGGPLFGMSKDNLNGFCGPRTTNGEIPLFYNKHTMILTDNSSLMLYDMTAPETYVFGNWITPTFNPTAISQFVYDDLSDTIWVTCANTGLYSIQDPTGTPVITHHDLSVITGAGVISEQAYTVCLGQSQTTHRTVLAIVEGALIKSTDNGVTWVAYDSTSVGVKFTHTAIETDWSRAMSMKSDKNHVDDRVMIIYHQDTVDTDVLQTYGIWWDTVNDVVDLSGGVVIGGGVNDLGFYCVSTVNGVFANAVPYIPEMRRFIQHWFDCSPKQSEWAVACQNHTATGSFRRPVKLTYGQTIDVGGVAWDSDGNGVSISNSATNYNIHATSQNSYTSDNMIYMTTDDNGNDCIVKQDAASEWWKLPLDMSPIVKLQNDTQLGVLIPKTGLALRPNTTYGYYVRHLGEIGVAMGWKDSAAVHSEIWDRYVWSGSDWILRDSDGIAYTTKITHATEDSLTEGLTISFDDVAGSRTYSDGEYYTVGVVNGVLTDANTDYDWEGTLICSQPIVRDLTTISSPTVPSAFINPKPISIFMNGDSADFRYNHDKAGMTSSGNNRIGMDARRGGRVTHQLYMDMHKIEYNYVKYFPNSYFRGADRTKSIGDLESVWSTALGRSKVPDDKATAYDQGGMISTYFGITGTSQYTEIDSAPTSLAQMDYGFSITRDGDNDNFLNNGYLWDDDYTNYYQVKIWEKGVEVYAAPYGIDSGDFMNSWSGSNNTAQGVNNYRYSDLNVGAAGQGTGGNPGGRYIRDGLDQLFTLKRYNGVIEYYADGRLMYTSTRNSDSDMTWFNHLQGHCGRQSSRSDVLYATQFNLLDWKVQQMGCWVAIGDSDAQTGAFDPDLRTLQCAVEAAYQVSLDGSPITAIDDGKGTGVVIDPLTASIYPREAYLRFTDSDVGKTIAVNFDYLTKK